MLRPQSRRGVRRAHSAPHSRIRSNLPTSPTPIYTGNGKILYIDATPPSSAMPTPARGAPDDREMIAQTPSLLNGHPIVRRMRHYSDQPHKVNNQRLNAVGKSPVISPMTHTDRRSGSSVNKRHSGGCINHHHHQSIGNLSQIQKPGSLYHQPQAISRWYELDDSSSQTSLASSDHTHLAHVPPMLTIQPPSSHNLSIPEPESTKAYLNAYPPSPYEYDSPFLGPFSAAFEEMESLSPSSSFYGGASSISSYVPSPLAVNGKMSVRSNVLHVPMSPISPYAVTRPKSPAPSIGSQISTSTISAPNRPPLRQSTPLGGRGTHYDHRDTTRVNLMPKLDEESRTGSAHKSPISSPTPAISPSHNSHSLDCLDSSTTAIPLLSDSPLAKEGHSSSSPSLRANGINPAVFRFPVPHSPSFLVSADTQGRNRHLSSHSSRRVDQYRPRILSKFPRSTSQTSVQSLSLRSDVSASAGSMISTRSDMWGGRRLGAGHSNNMRFSRQYHSYRRPHVSSNRGQRAYKSFRQELLMRSM